MDTRFWNPLPLLSLLYLGKPLFFLRLKIAGLTLCLIVLGSAIHPAAANWMETLTPPTPGNHPEIQPCHVEFVFGWFNILQAARMTADLHVQDTQIVLNAQGATSGFVRTLWRLNVCHETVLDRSTFRPIRMCQKELYATREVLTEATFSPNQILRKREVITQMLSSQTPARWKKISLPNVFDMVGAALLIRSFPLKANDTIRLTTFPGDSPFFIEAHVAGREEIKVAKKLYNAIRLELTIKRVKLRKDAPPQLEEHQKFHSGRIWISDDVQRLPLRVEADVFIGFVYAEMTKAVEQVPAPTKDQN